ncbi:MAG: FkbM family methyltransferase [Pseudomonadota bacterium]
MLNIFLLNLYAVPLRLIRPNVGLTSLSFNRLTNALLRNAQSPLVARLPCGARIDIDPQEYHGRITWMVGSGDWKVSRTVNALLSPGNVLLDIGANYGSIGFEAAAKVGPQGEVHMFEPQTRIADRLAAAMAGARFSNVKLHRLALSNKDGEVVLAGPSQHSGMATIIDSETLERPRDHSETVEMRDTALFIRPLVEGRSFGVKIDIEGAEPMVLPGLVEQESLKFVVFEGANEQRWLWDFFTGAGFTIFGLERSILRSQISPLRSFDDWSKYHDFLAIKTDQTFPNKPMGLGEFRGMLDAKGW